MRQSSSSELVFSARVRKRTPRAVALHLEGLASEVWVPVAVVRLERRNVSEVRFPYLARIRRRWALRQERIVHLLAKRVAGEPPRAGLFLVREVAPARLIPGPVEQLAVEPAHEFAAARSRADLSLHETAALLGLEPAAVSRLEAGAVRFAEEGMWARAMEALEGEAQRRARIAARIAALDGRATRD